ncbi:WG repeat-containing protein [Pyxidicoccus fallax]|uniref:WG repeat-containing protein n=1 Tax=Pyxidicoccus fallax TaxID=394095 RepID=A0A848LW29_9BACT|nr:WG repeat-containing protein [Pyxidicoccus fallax]NMO21841.1 WG repeat-containing protein [Pyxidicoccus fallax]NPC83280.1 WG repeat-containing protein [Pyxidicoccus fallax]
MSVRHGYIDVSGAFVIPSPHGNLFRFNEGLARMPVSGAWAFIDPKGRERLRVERAFTGFSDGLALTGEGFINPKGKVVLPVRFLNNFTRYVVGGKSYGHVGLFGSGLAPVTPPGAKASSAFIDKKGEVVLDGFGGGMVERFVDGKARVHLKTPPKGEVSRLIDPKGRCLASYPFKSMGSFSEGLALAHKARKLGFVDEAGAWVLEPAWSSWERDLSECRFSEGLAPVKVKGRYGFIDRKGTQVIAPRFKAVVGGFSQGVAPVKEDGLFGYIHPDGSWAIPPRFTSVQPFAHGLAAVSLPA